MVVEVEVEVEGHGPYLNPFHFPRTIYSLLTRDSVFSGVRKLSHIADEMLTPDPGAIAEANIALKVRDHT